MRLRQVLFASCLVGASATSNAGWIGGPEDYNECILESMKGVKSDQAARAIIRSCQEKFPNRTRANARTLSADKLGKLSGELSITSYGWVKGRIYNGNSETTLVEITITLKQKGNTGGGRTYSAPVKIEPQSVGDINFPVFSKGESSAFEWWIAGARGY